MTKLMIITFSFIVGLSFLNSGCSYRHEKESQTEISYSQELLGKVSYQLINKKILMPKCVLCHGHSGGVSLETYAEVYGYIDKIKEVSITTSSMPKAPYPSLNDEERTLLATWIKAGAPENALGGSDTEMPPANERLLPTFASIKKNILQNKCLVCHSPGNDGEDVSLNSAEDMINSPRDIVIPGDPDSSELVLSVLPTARKIMPPKRSGISQLKPEEIEIIKQWIMNGAKP